MIARSALVKLASLGLAVGLHAAILVGLDAPEQVELSGAGDALEARLGTSFRDLAAGVVLSPADTAATERPVAPETARTAGPVEARRVEARTAPLAPSRKGDVAVAAEPGTAMRAVPLGVPRPDPDEASGISAPPPPHREVAVVPAPGAAARAVTADAQVTAPRSADAPRIVARTPEVTVRATAQASTAPGRSLRPPARPENVVREPAPEPPRIVAATAETGSSPARAGTVDGRAAAPAARAGAGRAESSAGSSAASSYPGQVMRCISSAGRPRVSARGTAVVAFRISGQGRVTGATLAASSGNAELDRAALRTIAGAGPCPAPPAGAQTAFSIRVRGR